MHTCLDLLQASLVLVYIFSFNNYLLSKVDKPIYLHLVIAILLGAVNPLSAALAFSNIALYAGIYTPLKRVHPINTWCVSLFLQAYFFCLNLIFSIFRVGGIVGAIPPGMSEHND